MAPFLSARELAVQFRREGQKLGRRHLWTLMRGRNLYRRPRRSNPSTIYPTCTYADNRVGVAVGFAIIHQCRVSRRR